MFVERLAGPESGAVGPGASGAGSTNFGSPEAIRPKGQKDESMLAAEPLGSPEAEFLLRRYLWHFISKSVKLTPCVSFLSGALRTRLFLIS